MHYATLTSFFRTICSNKDQKTLKTFYFWSNIVFLLLKNLSEGTLSHAVDQMRFIVIMRFPTFSFILNSILHFGKINERMNIQIFHTTLIFNISDFTIYHILHDVCNFDAVFGGNTSHSANYGTISRICPWCVCL